MICRCLLKSNILMGDCIRYVNIVLFICRTHSAEHTEGVKWGGGHSHPLAAEHRQTTWRPGAHTQAIESEVRSRCVCARAD